MIGIRAQSRSTAFAAILALSPTFAGIAWGAEAQPTATESQAALPMTLNDGAGTRDALGFDWPMLSIGTGQYEDGPTGLTVIRFKERVHAAIDTRGGGPGTVNSDYLRLGYEFPELDAIVLAGGSWYGLEAVTAVNTALKDDGARGGHWDNVGLVEGSIIYDFGGRRLNEIYPDKRLAQAAMRAARPGWFPVGAYGAGRSAVTGGIFGCNARSGQGAAFRQIGEVKIAVFTVVNALGVVVDRDGKVVSCHKGSRWPDDLTASYLMRNAPASLQPGWNGDEGAAPDRKNTTISLVVTNRKMSKAELNRLAVQVHTSMARAIQPFATEMDGDVLYAVSTAEVENGPGNFLPSAEIGVAASELMWDAVLAAVQPARQSPAVKRTKPLTAGAAAALAGDYRFSGLASLKVWFEDGALRAKATGERDVFAIRRDAAQELLPVSSDTYMVPGRYPLVLQFRDGELVLNPGRWQQVGRRN